jgi:tetratricopeptide (TPR) repeat protein
MNLATVSPILFIAAAFTLATVLDPLWSGMQRRQAKGAINMMVGDGKRLFANHFVIKADAYFHNGQYPSIFRQAREESHLTQAAESETHHEGHAHDDHSQCDHDGDGKPDGDGKQKAAASLNDPQDFIEKFGNYFWVSKHSHMKERDAKELLPWFRISAELDPTRVETYTVAAFWLRNTLKKPNEAEQFLREGWKANPDSYEIVFELGRLYEKDRKDIQRARSLFELALKKWDARESQKEKPDLYGRERILANLVEVEYALGDFRLCLDHLLQLEPISPYPDSIRNTIADVKSKLAAQR